MDNILVYHEVLHLMRKKKGLSEQTVIKIDLEKSYDGLSWDFIKGTLEEIGFNVILVRNLMECIKSPKMAILWNMEQLPLFSPEMGGEAR